MILQLPNSQLTKDFFVTLYNRSFLACLTSLIDNLKLFSVSSSLSDIFFSLTFLQTTLPLIERFICHGIADKSRHNCWTKESVWHKDFYVWNGMFRQPHISIICKIATKCLVQFQIFCKFLIHLKESQNLPFQLKWKKTYRELMFICEVNWDSASLCRKRMFSIKILTS